MKTIVLFLSAMFTLGISRAQFTQNFDGAESTLTGNCWSLTGVYSTSTPGDVINGTGSMTTNPPVSGSGTRDIVSPALNVLSTNLTISFLYKVNNPISGNATRTIEIGLLDVLGNYTYLDIISMDRNSPATVQSYSKTFTLASTGLRNLVLKLGGGLGDGSCRLIFDDIAVSANAVYGTGTCNTAPIAVNDTYLGLIGQPVSGNVMNNDNEPNGEAMTAAMVAISPDGVVVLNPNGSFTFTPNALFNGTSTTFTYRLTDNGFSPMNSNTATVTINFVAPSPLPVKLASFTATLNNNKADLKWTTVTEINASHFVIEKSTDGINYNDAGMVFAVGNTTEKTNYLFTDNLAGTSARVIYYRLRSVDLDAKTSLSEVRIIRLIQSADNTITILAYPNPVVNDLRVTVPAAWQNKKVVFEVIGANGHTAIKKESLSSGQTETLNVATLATGFYIVRVSCEGLVGTQKIVKN